MDSSRRARYPRAHGQPYSLTKGQAAIRDWFGARHDRTGSLALLPAIFPDQMAPIVRVGPDGEREVVMALGHAWAAAIWRPAGVTNIRNVSSASGRL
jgi:hypothetical protein